LGSRAGCFLDGSVCHKTINFYIYSISRSEVKVTVEVNPTLAMAETTLSPLVSPEDVKALIERDEVVIVDARGGADATERYNAGHLPGALMVNLETDLSDIGPDAAQGGRHPLPDPSTFAQLLGKLGISPLTHVLVYDDKAGANAAARFWWMMRAVGHENIQVVDGGLAAMQQVGVTLVKDPVSLPRPVLPYPVSIWQLPLANINDVDRMRTGHDSLVIDVRERFRYRGESEPIDLVAGHIPGAINIPYLDNLKASGRFRAPEELAEMYHEAVAGKVPGQVCVHCGSGVTACHTALAMEVAGLPVPRLYVGSWSEWSRNHRPVAKGENP